MLEDISQSSTTKIPVFKTPPVECHWIGMTWGGIKENVLELVNSVEITMRDIILSAEAYAQRMQSAYGHLIKIVCDSMIR